MLFCTLSDIKYPADAFSPPITQLYVSAFIFMLGFGVFFWKRNISNHLQKQRKWKLKRPLYLEMEPLSCILFLTCLQTDIVYKVQLCVGVFSDLKNANWCQLFSGLSVLKLKGICIYSRSIVPQARRRFCKNILDEYNSISNKGFIPLQEYLKKWWGGGTGCIHADMKWISNLYLTFFCKLCNLVFHSIVRVYICIYICIYKFKVHFYMFFWAVNMLLKEYATSVKMSYLCSFLKCEPMCDHTWLNCEYSV